ncbi:MAG: EI24 domain-containing protein [Porphyrobacter sp.]|nr:EI24 domain-containing protein [Porphyrobacter sp.]
MSAVPAAIVKAFSQLGDRAVVRVAVKSIAITLVLFAGVGVGLYFGLAALAERYALDGRWAGVAAVIMVPLAMWFLFRIVALAVLQFFADEVVAAVEVRHYPAFATTARPLPLTREVAAASRSLLRALGYNLLAVPLAVVLVFTAIGPAVVFLGVNAVLLGRELTDMAWQRHCSGDERANPVPRAERMLLGAAVAGLMLVPFVNLLAPLVGAAAGAHLVLRRIATGARP